MSSHKQHLFVSLPINENSSIRCWYRSGGASAAASLGELANVKVSCIKRLHAEQIPYAAHAYQCAKNNRNDMTRFNRLCHDTIKLVIRSREGKCLPPREVLKHHRIIACTGFLLDAIQRLLITVIRRRTGFPFYARAQTAATASRASASLNRQVAKFVKYIQIRNA